MTFKPMKGDPVDFTQLTFPKLVSPKIDGVRAVITKGAVLSSKLKPLPNKWLQSIFAHKQYDGLDGELAVGDPFDPLLVSVRSGAKFSMPGMMDTILNLGLNDTTVKALAKATGQVPQWNFHKYLIGRDGRTVASFGTRTAPDDKALVAAIEAALAVVPANTSVL